MNRAMCEVDEDVVVRERIARRSRMAGIGARRGVSNCQRVGHRRVADGAGESAVADHLQLTVPSARGHPDFGLDIGSWRRLQRDRDPAELAEFCEHVRTTCRSSPAGWWREAPSRNGLRQGDGPALHGERREAIARRSRCHRRQESRRHDHGDDSGNVRLHTRILLLSNCNFALRSFCLVRLLDVLALGAPSDQSSSP